MTSEKNKDTSRILEGLVSRIRGSQYRRPGILVAIGLFEKIKGLFRSDITYYAYPFRRFSDFSFPLRIPDNNAFVTMWTLDLLMESFESDAELLGKVDTEGAVKALMEFHDRTREKESPLFMFWRQKNFNGKWIAFPANLFPFVKLYIIFRTIGDKTRKFYYRFFTPKKKEGHPHSSGHPRRTPSAFTLTADFDDSALNWSLGLALERRRGELPGAWSVWSAMSFDFEKLARRAVECSYRPFSEDESANSIDPRSFFAIREFLWAVEAEGGGTQGFSLLTTWASNLQENPDGIQRHYKMPFNVNNMDYSVQANFIYAAARSAIRGYFPGRVEGIESLIKDTASHVAWGIESSTIKEKPDIALLYYPSPFCAYFFISRIVHLLDNPGAGAEVPGFLLEAGEPIAKAVRGKATEDLLSSVEETDDQASWRGTSMAGEPVPAKAAALDDRKFITAVAVNTLFNAWTFRKGSGFEWRDDVPTEVRRVVGKGLEWLMRHGLSRRLSDSNAFFSASVKHESSLPFMFPANMEKHIRGPILLADPEKDEPIIGKHSTYAMSGVPTRTEYEIMLEQSPYSRMAGEGLKRCYELQFPFWSAPSVTYAAVCLAVSRGSRLRGEL